MTPEEIKAVWESTQDPSIRKVLKVLKGKGVKMSIVTLQRMKSNGWSTHIPESVRAAKKKIRTMNRLPPKLVADFLVTANEPKSKEQSMDFAVHVHLTAFPTAWFLFLGQADKILEKHPQAFASIIAAFSASYEGIKDKPDDKNVTAKMITEVIPTEEQSNDELREFMRTA